MQPKTLLDTDVLSALMRRNPAAIRNARNYLADYSQLSISIITRFEILRGLKAANATTRLTAFDAFCAANEVLSLTDQIVVRAADIYANLYQSGQLIGDADILIAATALEEGCHLATNNVAHFQRIAGLQIEDWLS